MRVVSLFAGIGGFDLGFERAGHTIVAHVEKDANCRKLLAAKWPNAVALDDVCTAGAHNLPPCDIVTFGFPCQDLSVAGKRAGLAGSRSGLFHEAVRIINELRPAYCLFENVPGLLSSAKGRDFAVVLATLDEIGYHGAWRVLDAQWFGVAQRRRRVFGLFSRLDSGAARCAEVLSLAESLRGHPAPSREAGEGVAATLESRAGGGGYPGTDGACGGHVVPVVAMPLMSERHGTSTGPQTQRVPVVAHTLRGEGHDASEDGTGRGTPIVAVRTANTMANGHGIAEDVTHTLDGANGQAVLAPMVVDAVCPFDTTQITSPTNRSNPKPGDTSHPLCSHANPPSIVQIQWASGGGQVENQTAQALRAGAEHNYQFLRTGLRVRRLTPRECERLQGFPDDWTAGFSDSTRYRMLGNAVCVNVSEWIVRRFPAFATHPLPTPDAPVTESEINQ